MCGKNSTLTLFKKALRSSSDQSAMSFLLTITVDLRTWSSSGSLDDASPPKKLGFKCGYVLKIKEAIPTTATADSAAIETLRRCCVVKLKVILLCLVES